MRRESDQAGQATVEFALVGLLLVIVILGIFEVGRAVMTYNTLSQATREGARYAIVHGSRSEDPSGPGSSHFTSPDQDAMVTGVVEQHASNVDPQKLTVRAEWPDASNQRGDRVKVSAEYQFQTMFSNLLGFGDIALTASSTMRITY